MVAAPGAGFQASAQLSSSATGYDHRLRVSTPGCGGIAHERDGRCPRCEIAARPPGARRLFKQVPYSEHPDGRQGSRDLQREAGS